MAAVILGDLDDKWTCQTNATIAMLDIIYLETIRKGALRRALKDHHIQVALNSKASLSSLLWMPDSVEWFTLQNHVNDCNAF